MKWLFLAIALATLAQARDCHDAVKAAETLLTSELNLAEANTTLPRRFHQRIAISSEVAAIQKLHNSTFSALTGLDTFEFGAGPGVGQARALASSISRVLSQNNKITSTEKAILWRESKKVFRVLSPEWDMREISPLPAGQFLFQGATPSLPDSDLLPILYIDERGRMFTGLLPKITPGSESEFSRSNFRDSLKPKN